MSAQFEVDPSDVEAPAVDAEPGDAIQMAYERILNACDRATVAQLTPGGTWLQIFHEELVGAQEVLQELASMLGFDHRRSADERATLLLGTFAFAAQQLANADIEHSVAPLRAVRRIVDGLHESASQTAAQGWV